MKRQKNYRQLRSKSSARNRLNEIKSRTDATVTRHSDATINAENNNLFGEYAEKPAYGEPPEDRFENAPMPDFQFDWDEEFFGTALPESNGITETKPFENQAVEKETVKTVNEELKQDTDSVIQEDVTAVNIPEPVEPTPAATVETEPEPERPATFATAPTRFVSVKRRMAMTPGKTEKLKKPQQTGKTGDSTKVRSKMASQKSATSIADAGKKSETPALNVRHAPSFRSFVISTIQRLLQEQRFLAAEPESSRFISRELGAGKREELSAGDKSTQETGVEGKTRFDNPFKPTASSGLSYNAGAKLQKSYSARLAGEKSSATRSSKAGEKPKPTKESYQLKAARFTLMEAMLNAKGISGNMKMKW